MKYVTSVKVNELSYGLESPLDTKLARALRKELLLENPVVLAVYEDGTEEAITSEEGFHIISKIIVHNKDRDKLKAVMKERKRIQDKKDSLFKNKIEKRRKVQKHIKRETRKAKKL